MQQQILLKTLNAIGAIVYVIDVETEEILFANEACKREFGEVEGKQCYVGIHRLEETCSFCIIKNNADKHKIGTTVEWEYQNRFNGKIYQSHDTIVEWTNGKIAKVQVAFDITEKTKTESELKKSEARFRSLFEGHRAMMYIVDPTNGTLIDVNNAAAEFYGYGVDELRGEHISKIHTFTKEQIDEARQRAANSPQTLFMVNHRLRNGEIRSMEIYTSPVEVEGKKALFSILHDVTERTKAEDALKHLNETLELRVEQESAKRVEQERVMMQQSRMAAMGEMIGSIAHQWRQPLNALGIMVQDTLVAQRYGEMNEEYLEEFVKKSMMQVRFMSSTIDDFRNFFRQDTEAQPFNITLLINEVVQMISAQLTTNAIGLNIQICHDCEPISKGYANEFKQVVLNIITNAKDQLLSKKTASPKIDIEIFQTQSQNIITISDNAGGIEVDILEKIFDPYFTTKAPDKGTGIGLYMAKTIIESHMHGELDVENDKQGAKFTIKIPRA